MATHNGMKQGTRQNNRNTFLFVGRGLFVTTVALCLCGFLVSWHFMKCQPFPFDMLCKYAVHTVDALPAHAAFCVRFKTPENLISCLNKQHSLLFIWGTVLQFRD